MARLPNPGGDNGTWGNILNDYLNVSLDTDGAIRAGAVGAEQLSTGAVIANALSDHAVGFAKLSQEVIDQLGDTPGASAYEVAQQNGFIGTEAQWLTSLHGANGTSVTVSLVPAALWPPAPDADPLHWYVKVPDA